MHTNRIILAGMQGPSSRASWIGLTIMTLSAISAQGNKSVMALLLQPIKNSLHFSDTQMGLLEGTSIGIAYLLVAIPLGLWVDRGTRVRIFLLGSVLWSIGTLATGLVGGFVSLFLARLLVGIGGVVLNPAGISLIADWFPPRQRGIPTGLFSAGTSAGAALGTAAGGALLRLVSTSSSLVAMAEPWRWVQIAFGVYALIGSALLLLLREPARHETLGQGMTLRKSLRRLSTHFQFLGYLIGGVTFSLFVLMSASIWPPAVLSRTFHLSPVQFASWLSAVLLLAGVGGSFLGGLIAHVWGDGKPDRLMRLAAWTSLPTIPVAGFAMLPSATSFAVALMTLLLFNTVARIQVTTALAIRIPNELRGLAMGIDIFIAASIGFSVAPAAVGLLSDHLGTPNGLRLALLAICVPSASLSTLLYYLCAKAAQTAPGNPVLRLAADEPVTRVPQSPTRAFTVRTSSHIRSRPYSSTIHRAHWSRKRRL